MSVYDPETERLNPINEALSLIEKKTGVSFGTDSYLLAAFARRVPHGTAAELGGGNGAVSLLTAVRGKYAYIHSVELQNEYASLIRRNAELNGLTDRIRVWCRDVRDLNARDLDGEVHAVMTNPPYFAENSGLENRHGDRSAARHEENGTLGDFCGCGSRLLRTGGSFSVVFRPERMPDLFFEMRRNRLEPKRLVLVHPYPEAKPNLLLCEARKDAAPGLVTSRPLFIYPNRTDRVYTEDMQRIYDTFSLEHLF